MEKRRSFCDQVFDTPYLILFSSLLTFHLSLILLGEKIASIPCEKLIEKANIHSDKLCESAEKVAECQKGSFQEPFAIDPKFNINNKSKS